MIGKRQFSLGYLLLEVGLFALAMGFTRLGFVLSYAESEMGKEINPVVGFIVGCGAVACWGAAVGGLFGKIIDGVIWAFFLFLIGALLMPAVNV